MVAALVVVITLQDITDDRCRLLENVTSESEGSSGIAPRG
jgi:hypothetical protein